ncbi:MAG TPA: histidine kinase dimerization/phospho-acceptor domain-containing protein, partial [Thermodesulfobacteriota bacterium]|nr:histidine kinase dimerization/phospho-acceptor domain-containing protein [Thermodesulfobacteriota bacterium]
MSSKGKIKFYKRLDVRMAVWYTVTFLTMIILIFGFLDYRFRRNLLKEIDRILFDEAHEIINQIHQNPLRINEQLKVQEGIVLKRKYYPIAFQVFDHQGNLIYASSKLRDVNFPKLSVGKNIAAESVTTTIKGFKKKRRFRLCSYFYREEGKLKFIVQVSTDLHIMRQSIENFREHLLTTFFLAFLFGSIGGWFLSRKNLKPIDTITEATKLITANNLSERLPLQGTDDELERLAITLNQMIERLEEYLQKLTQFTADAAHELRTPITALKGETEVLLSKTRSQEEYQEALINNLERFDFLTKLVNDLLI